MNKINLGCFHCGEVSEFDRAITKKMAHTTCLHCSRENFLPEALMEEIYYLEQRFAISNRLFKDVYENCVVPDSVYEEVGDYLTGALARQFIAKVNRPDEKNG